MCGYPNVVQVTEGCPVQNLDLLREDLRFSKDLVKTYASLFWSSLLKRTWFSMISE